MADQGAGGYDISPATSRATAEAAQQSAGTTFIFGNNNIPDLSSDFTATPTATATASTSKGANSPGGSNEGILSPDFGGDTPAPPNYTTLAIVIGAAIVLAALLLRK